MPEEEAKGMLAGDDCEEQDGILYYDQQLQVLPGRSWTPEELNATDVSPSRIEMQAPGEVLGHYSGAHSMHSNIKNFSHFMHGAGYGLPRL